MAFDPESTTAILARRAPFLGWLRTHFTIPAMASIGGILVTVIGTGFNLMNHVEQLERQVERLNATVDALRTRDTTMAAIEQHLKDVDERLREQQERWEWIDQNVNLPPRRYRR
jgi:biotin-(acetyl-CoA carboxylase) ligase